LVSSADGIVPSITKLFRNTRKPQPTSRVSKTNRAPGNELDEGVGWAGKRGTESNTIDLPSSLHRVGSRSVMRTTHLQVPVAKSVPPPSPPPARPPQKVKCVAQQQLLLGAEVTTGPPSVRKWAIEAGPSCQRDIQRPRPSSGASNTRASSLARRPALSPPNLDVACRVPPSQQLHRRCHQPSVELSS
jgi:hypothetical protein